MVYGRYNELVHGGDFMVYKPTNITGGPHHVWDSKNNEAKPRTESGKHLGKAKGLGLGI